MKKLILVLLLLPVLSLAQQSWVEPGSVWYYGYTGFGAGVHILRYNTDTVIQNKTCQKIEGEYYSFNYSSPPPAPIVAMGPYPLETRYTYYSNDTVYYLYHNNNFYPLYIFSAQTGDEWTLQSPTDTCCYCTSTNVQVGNTETVVINGQALRALMVYPAQNSNASFNNEGVGVGVSVIEKIGVISTGYLFPLGTICQGVQIWDPTTFHFNCFNSPSLSYTMANDCDELAPVSENIMVKPSFNLYPNPTSNTINLQSNYSKLYSITLYDVTGKRLLTQSNLTGNNTIDISSYENGLYLLTITTAQSTYTRKLLKQ